VNDFENPGTDLKISYSAVLCLKFIYMLWFSEISLGRAALWELQLQAFK